jgi:hypothetical protein
MADDQLARLQWVVAPELHFVPFRGKLSLFSVLFVEDLADAVRSGRVVLLSLGGGTDLFYGKDQWVDAIRAKLADGQALKAATAEHLKRALEKADLIGLLSASESSPQK